MHELTHGELEELTTLTWDALFSALFASMLEMTMRSCQLFAVTRPQTLSKTRCSFTTEETHLSPPPRSRCLFSHHRLQLSAAASYIPGLQRCGGKDLRANAAVIDFLPFLQGAEPPYKERDSFINIYRCKVSLDVKRLSQV